MLASRVGINRSEVFLIFLNYKPFKGNLNEECGKCVPSGIYFKEEMERRK
jgi:hypothetical protein